MRPTRVELVFIAYFTAAVTSSLRNRVDEALLRLKENGVYDQIYRKWFGSESRD